ncbi:ferredoxin [Actibacterium sp. 188UL27-1]|uniref:ferredoxin n=1 Tax=Actibacterium sp. 188UL27-1 TaxID=2786961 RepID=UPI001957CB79|nr:ferredoxin [Actibacterium sp. 188UL27-1]MBM7069962.1 ferredoxin [Actibacterium sp. 188UL27-1]
MDAQAVTVAPSASHLQIAGGFHPTMDDDHLPAGTKTLLLLAPQEPGFWTHVSSAPEWSDGLPDPLDRWSRRVIDDVADVTQARALYPFGGPPHWPFLGWATRTGQIWSSPIGLLVHNVQGLWISFRGALALPYMITLAEPPTSPCATCADKPCEAACPVLALTAAGYDVPACKAFVTSDQGLPCRSQGCAVRAACPVSQTWPRSSAQSAFHMEAFVS